MFLSRSALAGLALALTACAANPPWPAETPPPRPLPTHVNALAKPSQDQAARFLQQATFGPDLAAINSLTAQGYGPWLQQQFATPRTVVLPLVEAKREPLTVQRNIPQNAYFSAFWKTAATAPDQLRQRSAYALSQIFVVSFDSMLNARARAVASYHDMLARNAFGNFRSLIEEITLHPAMGVYLTHMRNKKEDPASGRVPDENFARELMQLFTIGLYELNLDGSLKLKNGQPIETYDNEDITALAKVFTGYSDGGSDYSVQAFHAHRNENWEMVPMKVFPQYHSTSEKKFLNVHLPATNTSQAEAELKITLDALFNHPNVGPFIGRQLIQRLVTSNPSPAYVRRVAMAFNNNGAGVRGDMQALITAVLTDPEALAPTSRNSAAKLREPVLRLAQWMRAFDATSTSGEFLMPNTDNPANSLGQSPMRSPSVFNFYRPGYIPPGTQLAQVGMVAPEMQIVSESSVAGYANFMQSVVEGGVGRNPPGDARRRDIQPNYSAQMAVADDASKLVDQLNLLLTARQLSPESVKRITEAVASIDVPKTPNNANTGRVNRVRLGILLTMVSPEYLVQH